MRHSGLHPIKLNLSHSQVLKAKRGQQIQVAHHQMGHGHTFHLHPTTHKKLHTAHRAGKGSRIHITHHELAGSGFLDVLKSVASPVLSGLAGVAGELFPSHKGTISKVREGIRTATGYGLRSHKKTHKHHELFQHGAGYESEHMPSHYPGQPAEHFGSGVRRHKKKSSKKGRGIMPSGYGY